MTITLARHGSKLAFTTSTTAGWIRRDGLDFAMLETAATLLITVAPCCPIFRSYTAVREILNMNVCPLVSAGALLQLELLHQRPRACNFVREKQLECTALTFITREPHLHICDNSWACELPFELVLIGAIQLHAKIATIGVP